MRAKNWHTWGGIPINRILKKLSEIICKISNLTAPFFLSTSVRSRDSYPPSWPLSSPYPYPDRWRGFCSPLDLPHLFIRIWSGHVTPVHLLSFPSGHVTSLHYLYLPPLPIQSSHLTPVHNLKGTVSRDFLLQVFFMNHLPPSPWK
jgi:hypothetical protein